MKRKNKQIIHNKQPNRTTIAFKPTEQQISTSTYYNIFYQDENNRPIPWRGWWAGCVEGVLSSAEHSSEFRISVIWRSERRRSAAGRIWIANLDAIKSVSRGGGEERGLQARQPVCRPGVESAIKAKHYITIATEGWHTTIPNSCPRKLATA